jgi:hypothetical protein
MGASLVGEGILSACYHICPTDINFQFDTTFMYAIALLMFLQAGPGFHLVGSNLARISDQNLEQNQNLDQNPDKNFEQNPNPNLDQIMDQNPG